MRIPAFDERRELEDRKLEVMKAMTLAWPTRGVVTIDLASGLVTSEAPKAEPHQD